jgi:hypothetical protein
VDSGDRGPGLGGSTRAPGTKTAPPKATVLREADSAAQAIKRPKLLSFDQEDG